MKVDIVEPARPPRHYTRKPSVIRKIAGALDRSAGGVAVDLYGQFGVFKRAEKMLEHLVRFGADKLALRVFERFKTILERREAPPDVPATWRLAQEADAKEDVAELAYLCERTPENRDRLIAAKEAARQKDDAVLLTLYADKQRAAPREKPPQ